MGTQQRKALKRWARSLPHSKMVFPRAFDQRMRYLAWRFYAPAHPFFRDLFLFVGIVKRQGRQDYLLGTLMPGRTVQDLAHHLVAHGYANHFVALRDDGELIGLRLVEDFVWQYHIRIFEDGEVRGHYEYTPECFPFKHMRKVHQQHREEEFLALLDGWIVPSCASARPAGVVRREAVLAR